MYYNSGKEKNVWSTISSYIWVLIISFIISIALSFIDGAILLFIWNSLASIFTFTKIEYWTAFIIMIAVNFLLFKLKGTLKVTTENS